jgi:hypothetical protein
MREAGIPELEIFTTFLRSPGRINAMAGRGEGALSPDGKWASSSLSADHLVLLDRSRRAAALPGAASLAASSPPEADLFDADDAAGAPPASSRRQVGSSEADRRRQMRAVLVSPDGRAVAAKIEGGITVYAVGGEAPPRRIAGGLASDIPIRWSSDGRSIYVGVLEERPLRIYRLDLATGGRELWKELSPPDPTGFLRYGPRMRGVGLSLTPDGQYYAYTYFTDQDRLVLARGDPNW